MARYIVSSATIVNRVGKAPHGGSGGSILSRKLFDQCSSFGCRGRLAQELVDEEKPYIVPASSIGALLVAAQLWVTRWKRTECPCILPESRRLAG